MSTKKTSERDIRLAMETLEENKASDVVGLDLRKLCDATDYFVVASGTSDTHVRALANRVIEALESVNQKPHHVEGLAAGRWALLDYVDFVVHVFHPTLRNYYQLERLWGDAPSVSVSTR